MESILRQLFQGQLHPCKTMIPNSEEYTELVEDFETNSEYLSRRLAELSPGLEQTFSSLIDTMNILHAMEAEELFAQSFSLAFKIFIEAQSVS